MKKTVWQMRVPTIVGLVLIMVGVALTSFFVKNGANFIGKASPADAPDNVRVTNIFDTAFTITYTTPEQVTGAVSYGKDKDLGSTALDDRDQLSGAVQSYKVHHITVRNVEPNTTYFFSITSGGTTYVENANIPFQVTTGPAITTLPTQQEPLSGTIYNTDGKHVAEAIVYVVSNTTQTLSALAKDGTYIIPLNALRSENLESYAPLTNTSSLKVLIVGEGMQSTATLLSTQVQPVPPMTLSQSYDFTLQQSPIASVSGNFGFPTFVATPSANKDPKLLTPQKEESFTDAKPLFRGTTIPNATVKISIHSSTAVEDQAKADRSGLWTYRPKESLAPGQHTITITAPDQFGILKTITQSFTVYAAGSQVSQSATPSATPVVSSTPSPTKTPTPAPTATPTIPTPTTSSAVATVVPTIPLGGIVITPVTSASPTVTPPLVKTTTAPVPSVGNSATIIATITGTLLFAVGFGLFIITRGSFL